MRGLSARLLVVRLLLFRPLLILLLAIRLPLCRLRISLRSGRFARTQILNLLWLQRTARMSGDSLLPRLERQCRRWNRVANYERTRHLSDGCLRWGLQSPLSRRSRIRIGGHASPETRIDHVTLYSRLRTGRRRSPAGGLPGG